MQFSVEVVSDKEADKVHRLNHSGRVEANGVVGGLPSDTPLTIRGLSTLTHKTPPKLCR